MATFAFNELTQFHALPKLILPEWEYENCNHGL